MTATIDSGLAQLVQENRRALREFFGSPVTVHDSNLPTGLGALIGQHLGTRIETRVVVLTPTRELPQAIARASGAKYDESEFIDGQLYPRQVVEGELPLQLQGRLRYESRNVPLNMTNWVKGALFVEYMAPQ